MGGVSARSRHCCSGRRGLAREINRVAAGDCEALLYIRYPDAVAL
jgi:hypothetical protein